MTTKRNDLGISLRTERSQTHLEKDERMRIEKIATLHQEITDQLRSSLDKAIRIGQLLTEQKESLSHGEFTPWVKDHMPFTDRTARNYMRLFEEREKLKSENVSDLNQAYRFLKQLTWPGFKESGGEEDKRYFINLSVDDIGRDIIMDGIDWAKKLLNTDSIGRAVEHITYEWLMSSADFPELMPLERVKAWIERVYGVHLDITTGEKTKP